MRWIVPCFAALVFLGLALATSPAPHTHATRPIADRTDAHRYALQLQEMIVRIMQRYLRPVECEELAGAALTGLYEAAKVAPPATLQTEVNRAAKEGKLIALFIQTREALGNAEGVRGQRAILASIQAMTKILDPFCAIGPASENTRNGGEESQHGLGLEFADPAAAQALVIKTVTLGGPAQRAGLRPGDQITSVNGEPVVKSAEGQPHWSEEGTVQFIYTRPGSTGSRTVLLRSESFHPEVLAGTTRRPDNSWEYFLSPESKIAQVRVLAFNATTSHELPQIIQELLGAGMRGLILDLRWCPGGFLKDSRDAAYSFLGEYNPAFFVLPTPVNWAALADLYLDDHCRNASVWYRDGEMDNARRDGPYFNFVGFPIVVLINAETSGGAELVAAVLQDNKRACIVGQRTRGKGSVQRPLPLDGADPTMRLTIPIPGMELKLSAGLLVRPSGKNLNRYADSKPSDDWGVLPDPGLEFRLSPDLEHRLKDWWQTHSLRPGSSTESLPLDDPANDPQRQVAVELLQKALR